MPKIDRFVIARAAALAASGRVVHANLSGTTLGDFNVLGDILAVMHAQRAEPSRITFEITETAAAVSMQNATRLADRLRAFGFRIALDDFGSGWGAFRYLNALPVDMIKIEREFVRGLGVDTRSAQLIRGVVALARELGVDTIAEGVEDKRALSAVQELGIDYAQGFHIGRPRPVESVTNPASAVCEQSPLSLNLSR